MTPPSPRIAYLGPAGTFTHAAARKLFGPSACYEEAATIDGVFDAVRRSDATYGVVPIENSTEGSVTNTVDALIDGDGVVIRRELLLEVEQCLISAAPSLADVARVYSHPQALAQCRAWLATHVAGAQLVPTASTVAAVQEAINDPSAAAIGSRLAAELYHVPVLHRGVNDIAENATRFVVLATEDAEPTGDDKTSVTFAVHNERGALRRVLEIFDDHGINLTRIESRPSRRKAWDYVFLADLDGHREDENIKAALAMLSERIPMLRSLGSYPRYSADTALKADPSLRS
ncbi:MAG TPA: prephenate dehydratase [Gemmatimonadaceae bacterium]